MQAADKCTYPLGGFLQGLQRSCDDVVPENSGQPKTSKRRTHGQHEQTERTCRDMPRATAQQKRQCNRSRRGHTIVSTYLAWTPPPGGRHSICDSVEVRYRMSVYISNSGFSLNCSLKKNRDSQSLQCARRFTLHTQEKDTNSSARKPDR